jgi:hypothetical protein
MDTPQMNNLSEETQNLNPPKEQPTKKSPKSKLVAIIIGVLIIALVASLAFLFIKKDGQDEIVEDLFSGFSKLMISSAYAEDNFSLVAKNSDSLGVTPDSSYILKSKEPLKTSLIEDSLRIEPDLDYDIKKISDQEWEITPKQQPEPNILVKASLSASYITASGEQKQNDYSWAFQVKDNFKVIHSIPRELGTSVPLNSGIEVTFSHDNFVDFDKHFEISPTLPGFFEKHGRTAVFVAEDNMTAGTIYTVTVKNTLGLEGSNETLGQDYSFAFETRADSPQNSPNSSEGWLSVSRSFIETNSTEGPVVQIYARNITDKINTGVYKFNNWEQYFESVKQRDQLPWWSYSKEGYTEDVSKLNKVLSLDLDIQTEDNTQFLRFPDKLDKGFYLVELVGPRRTHQIWMQVNDLATYYTITKTDTILWVNSTKSGNPISNAQINIIDTSYNYKTDGQGIARFQIPDEVASQAIDKKQNARKYFKISGDGDVLILPASPISHRYSWSTGSNADDYWNYLYTDRPLYQTTDKIQYWGLLRERNNNDINDEVTIKLYKNGYVDYYYRPVSISEQTIEISNDGTFSGEIDIENLRPDNYTLQLKVGDRVIRTKYINIKPYIKPAYSLSITPDKKNAFIDDTINFKVKASFFEGTPVPNLKLKFKMPEGEYKFTTDENGEADLTYKKEYENCSRSYNCWPKRVSLSVLPEDSELAEIKADTYVRFYAPNVYLENKVSYPEAGLARIEMNSRFIDLDSMTSKNWWERTKGEQPAPNTKIEGELIKTTYTKIETGTKYDFINKKSYKTYRYDREDTTEDNFTIHTDANGQYIYEKTLEPNKSYRLRFKVFDENGYYDNYSNYLYYYDGKHLRRYSTSNYNYYHLELPEAKTFDIGERVEATFMHNEDAMPSENSGYLFLQLQNGLQDHFVSNSSKYNFVFQTADVPNISLRGVHFNGSSYITSQPKSIKFNTEKKQLKISITPDKALYKPGETAIFSFDVRDINNSPVQAELNVNLVDEAFYAVVDEEVSPLSTIYKNVGEGILNTRVTHRGVEDRSSMGAEKGCFTADTEILMADGSKKPIEQIEVGDKIKTFSDFISQELVDGEVTKVWEHTVGVYYIINEKLEVTPEHMVFANGHFMDVASLKVGDWLLNSQGEKVFIELIETRQELTKVYNFEVEPQHTYFAGGFYAHNEKGGGPREFFVDTALFDTVKTNRSGKGEIELTLPDNITSWRVTVQAISDDIKVGVATEKIPVSLPVFAEVTIGEEYLAADKPVARMRAFGTALNAQDNTNFFINASSLGVDESAKQTTPAFASAYFPLPDLSAGPHDIIYNLETDKGDDSLLLPINVIESRVAAQVAKSEKLTLDTEVTAMNDLPFAIILADQGQNQLYNPLIKLIYTHGSRVDQILPSIKGRELLNKYYNFNYSTKNFNAFDYQITSGGITLLPYSSEDLELSARVASVGAEDFDTESLSQYFYKVLSNRASHQEEISFALFGLASLNKPVLPRINSWLGNDELGPKEKLYLAQALLNLGDKDRSRELYLEVMGQYAEVKEPWIKVKVSEKQDQIFQATAIAAVLASSLDAPEASGLWGFLDDNQKLYGWNKNSEYLFTLERVNYIKDAISKLKPSPAEVKYKLAGRERTARLTGGSTHSFQLHPQHVDQLEFLEITGDVGITMSYTVPIDPDSVEVDTDIGIRREYYVDGVKTNTFHENDMIEVRLYSSFSGNALTGSYQVTDILPSGLMPVTKTQRWGGRYDCTFRYPYNAFGQSVKYKINTNWERYKCGEYIKYYARVRNKGTYVAEPAILQSFINPDFINYSAKETITIE